MISDLAFTEGLTRIGISVRQPPDKATFGVYYDAIKEQSTDEEWREFCKHVVRTGRFVWFPKVAELLDALTGFRGEPSLLAEASQAYERVLGAANYTPEGGASWTYRDVLERCGRACAQAFLEAGAHSAFVSTFGESKRRERFVEAYVEWSRQEPKDRLLPAGQEQKALPEYRDPSKADARAILERIAGMVE